MGTSERDLPMGNQKANHGMVMGMDILIMVDITVITMVDTFMENKFTCHLSLDHFKIKLLISFYLAYNVFFGKLHYRYHSCNLSFQPQKQINTEHLPPKK